MSFRIHNEIDSANIEILGGIGESWFDEGNTLKSVKSQLQDLDVSSVNVSIQSMGGDLMEALAIHDLFKNMSAKVIAKIVGATASAGTIVALGADDVEITENSRFLVHHASTVTMGNSEEHERAAKDLESWDEDILNIYQKKTGKRKSQIRNLMKEEKWITAEEAKEWGFVDKIIKQKIKNEIKMDKVLNHLGVEKEDEALNKIKEIQDELEQYKTDFNAQSEDLSNALKEIEEIENQRANELIESAIKAGKITEKQKEKYLNLADLDFEATKSVIDDIQAPGKIQQFIERPTDKSGLKKVYDDLWQNNKHELERILRDEPQYYAELYESKYGRKPRNVRQERSVK